MSQPIEIKVPDIGDFHDVPVIEICVQPGAVVTADTPLVTLESDKATMEVPAGVAGTVHSLLLKVGDRVAAGTPILQLLPAAGETAPAPVAPARAEPPAASDLSPVTAPASPPSRAAEAPTAAIGVQAHPHASPSVRRFARELGADLSRMRGSGPKGRILHDDVRAFVKSELSQPRATGALALPAMPVIDFAKWGPVETLPLSRIKKLSGAHLQRAWLTIPHVTQHIEADITELEAFRKAQGDAGPQGVRLTLLAFLLKACASALARFPEFNASLNAEGDALILKRYCHIGVAVDTPDGLVVPVLRDVERKGVLALARELAELSQKARDGKLGPAEMQGGSFTISSLGGIGGRFFTPIVNAPEVAILGASRAEIRPVWDGQAFVPRLMLPLSLSYDHRVVDGAAGARFATHLAALLADTRRLLL